MMLNRAGLRRAIETAHRRGLRITGHLCAVTYREAAEMGIDNLEHGFAAMTDFVDGQAAGHLPAAADRRPARQCRSGLAAGRAT